MGKYPNWETYAMETALHNEEARSNLRQSHESIHKMQESATTDGGICQKTCVANILRDAAPDEKYVSMRNTIIRRLRNAIPFEELKSPGSCVLVSLDELRSVRSLSPEDYQVKTQVNLIAESLMKCKTAIELQSEIDYLELTGYIFNGTRFLKLNESVMSVLRRYVFPIGSVEKYVSMFD